VVGKSLPANSTQDNEQEAEQTPAAEANTREARKKETSLENLFDTMR
jgi:hypothetical protein